MKMRKNNKLFNIKHKSGLKSKYLMSRNDLNLDHIAYAVKSTDKAIKGFKYIYPYVKVYKKIEKKQNVYISCLFNGNDTHYLELVEPMAGHSPVSNLIKEKESVLYHVGYRTDNFEKVVKIMKKNGYFMITEPFKPSFDNAKWACHFFMPETGAIEVIGS